MAQLPRVQLNSFEQAILVVVLSDRHRQPGDNVVSLLERIRESRARSVHSIERISTFQVDLGLEIERAETLIEGEPDHDIDEKLDARSEKLKKQWIKQCTETKQLLTAARYWMWYAIAGLTKAINCVLDDGVNLEARLFPIYREYRVFLTRLAYLYGYHGVEVCTLFTFCITLYTETHVHHACRQYDATPPVDELNRWIVLQVKAALIRTGSGSRHTIGGPPYGVTSDDDDDDESKEDK